MECDNSLYLDWNVLCKQAKNLWLSPLFASKFHFRCNLQYLTLLPLFVIDLHIPNTSMERGLANKCMNAQMTHSESLEYIKKYKPPLWNISHHWETELKQIFRLDQVDEMTRYLKPSSPEVFTNRHLQLIANHKLQLLHIAMNVTVTLHEMMTLRFLMLDDIISKHFLVFPSRLQKLALVLPADVTKLDLQDYNHLTCLMIDGIGLKNLYVPFSLVKLRFGRLTKGIHIYTNENKLSSLVHLILFPFTIHPTSLFYQYLLAHIKWLDLTNHGPLMEPSYRILEKMSLQSSRELRQEWLGGESHLEVLKLAFNCWDIKLFAFETLSHLTHLSLIFWDQLPSLLPLNHLKNVQYLYLKGKFLHMCVSELDNLDLPNTMIQCMFTYGWKLKPLKTYEVQPSTPDVQIWIRYPKNKKINE